MKETDIIRKYYVYILYREDGVTPFYVGMGHGKRWLEHEAIARRGKSKTRKSNIIRQMQIKGIEVPKRKVAEKFTLQQAYSLERSLIHAIGRAPNGPLCNLTDGGEGVYNPTPETRAKQSAANKGKKRTPEQIARFLASRGTVVVSAEARAKISAKLKGRKKPPRTEAHKAKIGLAQKGRKLSESHRRNIGDGNRGKKRDPEIGRKISETKTLKRWGIQPKQFSLEICVDSNER